VKGLGTVGYYLRAFCTSEDLPPLGRVFEWAAAQGVLFALENAPDPDELDSARWRWAELRYMHGKRPLVVDVSRAADYGPPFEEVEEFIELLEQVDESAQRHWVLAHLRESRAVVTVQLFSDIDDGGYDAVGIFLSFFVEHCGGMIHADLEGFYDGDRLIVKLA
jgi:hypothetical protein